MTVTTIDRPPAVHRRRVRGTSPFAVEVAGRFGRGDVVVVTVEEYVPGWYVTGVDRAARRFEVRRDGGEMVVAWSAVGE